ncbi:MAG: nucleotidyltransferase domain-containing protein [Deltaproteobacteria bacterium]|nr:nucleotidyltransferase domain-containing protein [Deltaproteobacteria bacterium]
MLEAVPEVVLGYLFGSQAAGRPSPVSDLDVAVLLDYQAEAPTIRDLLSHRLALLWPGRCTADVVILNRAPVELAYAVISQGILVYEREPASRVEYEARVLSQYGDYLPILREQRREILQGGKRALRVQWHREALGRTLGTLGETGAPQGKDQGRI